MNQQTHKLSDNFADASDPQAMFADERLMRMNSTFLRSYCRHEIKNQNLTLSTIAFDHFISLSDGELRKDGITPSEHHEHTHFLRLKALMKTVDGKLGYDPEKYGTIDALVTALYFHDMVEDRGQTSKELLKVLNNGIDEKLHTNKISIKEAQRMKHDAVCAIDMVRAMSRNEPDESGNIPNRSQYNNRWVKNPGAVIIKLLDWTNKLATMPGVESFENDDQRRMQRNLQETDHLFLDERQAVVERAVKLHRSSAKIFRILDAEMSVVFNMVKGYAFHASSGVDSSPKDEPPFNFTKLRKRLEPYTRNISCGGANMIEVTNNRIEANPRGYPKIADYHDCTLRSAIRPFLTNRAANDNPDRKGSFRPSHRPA